MGWGIMQGAIRAMGGSISMATRLIVSASFGAIQTIIPILSAQGMAAFIAGDIPTILMVGAGLAQLTTAIGALIAYETKQKKMSLQLRGLNFMFNNVSMMLSGLR